MATSPQFSARLRRARLGGKPRAYRPRYCALLNAALVRTMLNSLETQAPIVPDVRVAAQRRDQACARGGPTSTSRLARHASNPRERAAGHAHVVVHVEHRARTHIRDLNRFWMDVVSCASYHAGAVLRVSELAELAEFRGAGKNRRSFASVASGTGVCSDHTTTISATDAHVV